jgi:hypothetical protein
MKDLFLSLILGIALGGIITGAYYDGFVATEYKAKIQQASEALRRADNEIRTRDNDINVLLQYADALRTENKKLKLALTTIPKA